MDASDLISELSAWLPWASFALDVAYLVLCVLTIVVVSCFAAQMVNAETYPATPKRKTTILKSANRRSAQGYPVGSSTPGITA